MASTSYSRIKRKDFQGVSEILQEILPTRIKTFFGRHVQVGDFTPLTPAGGKPYTGRTIVPLFFDYKKHGDLYVLSFTRGDGTGNGDYIGDDIEIPKHYQFAEMPERVMPRNKTDVAVEACIPFFSIFGNTLAEGIISLEELTLKSVPGNGKMMVARDFYLGVDVEDYAHIAGGNQSYVESGVEMTTGFTRTGVRFGDPHAVHFPQYYPEAIQVVGFLPIMHKNNPLAHIIDRVVKSPYS